MNTAPPRSCQDCGKYSGFSTFTNFEMCRTYSNSYIPHFVCEHRDLAKYKDVPKHGIQGSLNVASKGLLK